MAKEFNFQAKGEVAATAPSRATTPTAYESCTNKEVVHLEGDETSYVPQPIKLTAPSNSRRATRKDVVPDGTGAGKHLELPLNWNVANKSDSGDPEIST
ncbi:hypothetical protein CDL15_Pgr006121 [Punica granatum]|uniref:Uncharacterized protein n=1 Tax=Punica granatum TaxID=22663 RepID=A0A218VUA0_PUNGR|nr:hypothetical protein CDL15_Pgr006121 [Punica granatum]PKI68043.1 hypothetical protein CRG98_011639 [Punica granatum]